MAKLVCDFEQVKKAGKSLIQAAHKYDNSINEYSNSVDSDLSSWSGVASNVLGSQVDSQIHCSNNIAEEVRVLGEYIIICANVMEEVENQLASFSI